jgi:hypothetical protein
MKTQQQKNDSTSKITQQDKTSPQKKISTVTPDNDNGKPGPPAKKNSANKEEGPKGVNL